MLQFGERVSRHGERSHAVQAVGGLPGLRLEACQLKFEWQAGASGREAALDVGVDSCGECFENLLRVRRIAFVLRLHVAAITQQAGIDIALQGGRAQDLGQAALSRPLPQLHLEQTVLSRHESLGKKQIVLVLGVDVGHAPAVAQHVYRLFAGPSP